MEYDAPYLNMACEICHQLTDEHLMLVCDGCELGYHLGCLSPPLARIPRGRWQCQRCTNDAIHGDNIHVENFTYFNKRLTKVVCL